MCSPGSQLEVEVFQQGSLRVVSEAHRLEADGPFSDDQFGRAWHVDDGRICADERHELGRPTEPTRQGAELHEAFDELSRHLRCVKEHQINHTGTDVAADGQDDAHEQGRPRHKTYRPTHPDPRHREDPSCL